MVLTKELGVEKEMARVALYKFCTVVIAYMAGVFAFLAELPK